LESSSTKYAKGYANSLVCTEKNGALPKFLYKRGTPYYIKSKIKGCYTRATNVLNSLKEQKTKQINEQIKVPEVLVIGPNGEHVGLKKVSDALVLASYAGLDLVLINAGGNPPVAKIIDYNKFRYERIKKDKDAKKKQKATISELKEFRLSPNIDVGDIEFKLKNVKKYLAKGDKIKLTLRFKGRQMAHTDIGFQVMQNFVEQLEDVASIEQKAKLEGRSISMILVPKK